MSDTNTPLNASDVARIRDVIGNAEHVTVRSTCTLCGHVAELDWPALALSHSEEKSLRTLARSIRCKSCGARGCTWQVSEAGLPLGDQQPTPPRPASG
jgi:hypothetical protein